MELMVAITILGAIVSVVYAAFSQISNASIQVRQSMEIRQELRLLMKIVLDDLMAVRYLDKWAYLNDNSSWHHTGILATRSLDTNNRPTSSLSFHAALPTRFYPEMRALNKDPELHEIGYSLTYNDADLVWEFRRREEFYLTADLLQGGREHVLSTRVMRFELEFLEKNIALQGSGELQEVWVQVWDSQENQCHHGYDSPTGIEASNPCLPLAIRLTMGLKDINGLEYQDTLEVNLPLSLQ